MSDPMLAALLLNFAGAAGFNTMLIGRHNLSPLTNKLLRLLTIGGAMAVFFAMFLFVKDRGTIRSDLLGQLRACFQFHRYIFLTGAADSLRSILALLALGLGIYFAIR